MCVGALILTGTRAAGKSAIARQLNCLPARFERVSAMTTRSPRDDDELGVYSYITEAQFDALGATNELLISTAYAGSRYGITREALRIAEKQGRSPLLIITPESAASFLARASESVSLAVFVDASDAVLDHRLAQRSQELDKATIEQRRRDRSFLTTEMRFLDNDRELDGAVEEILTWWADACRPPDRDAQNTTPPRAV